MAKFSNGRVRSEGDRTLLVYCELGESHPQPLPDRAANAAEKNHPSTTPRGMIRSDHEDLS